MKRFIEKHLSYWKTDPFRKVLLIRGARQVGKTYSVRQLAKEFRYFLEVNFESDVSVCSFFEKDLHPDDICRNLSAYYNIPVVDGETLLFFDEIQSCVPAISSLRFFHEKRPGLHVIAAGSLLEFALGELTSFGVGRIESLFMYPLSFDEFLLALHEDQLYRIKQESSADHPLNEALHRKLTGLLKQFLLLGGLPEVIDAFLRTGHYQPAQKILDQVIRGYSDDFAKYRDKIPVSRIREVFGSVVSQTGMKFNLSKVSPESNHGQIKEALALLEMAGLIYRVLHTDANGVPPGAEVNQKRFKMILFDHGVFQRMLGLNLSQQILADDVALIHKGNLAEQFCGTEIVKYASTITGPQLYYWHREKRGATAEVDYIIQRGSGLVPIEVKSGTQGKMQSLRIFMAEKNIPMGIRISLENFSRYDHIEVLPLYAIQSLIHPAG